MSDIRSVRFSREKVTDWLWQQREHLEGKYGFTSTIGTLQICNEAQDLQRDMDYGKYEMILHMLEELNFGEL